MHFVAARLSYLGFHAVPTTRNVAGPDVLVSNISGSKAVSIQVKTTKWAMRTRGRGASKSPHHCEWDIGWTSARLSFRMLFFALVDLRDFEGLPDVYVIPSQVIYRYFEDGNPETWKRARYHPSIDELEHFKNNWSLIEAMLREG